MIIRPISIDDLSALEQMATESGPGFTSLVNDRAFLTARIEQAVNSVRQRPDHPGDEHYLFVLEDAESGQVAGITGIAAAVGLDSPLYHYHRSQVVHHSRELGLYRSLDVLNMCNHYTGCTEICTLFLRPRFRRPNAGKLLSRARFLYMGQHPQRFASKVIAEMRGVCDDLGRSPFWSWLQTNFVDLDFAEVTRMVGAGDTGFIAELMPKYPLYTHLMTPEARDVIGQVHPRTRPALRLLEQEGFRALGYVDLFDAGPTVEAELPQIRSIRDSVTCPVQVGDRGLSGFQRFRPRNTPRPLLVANTGSEDFRATVTDEAVYLADHNRLLIPASLARRLKLDHGASARFTELAPARTLANGTTTTNGLAMSGRHTPQETHYAHR